MINAADLFETATDATTSVIETVTEVVSERPNWLLYGGAAVATVAVGYGLYRLFSNNEETQTPATPAQPAA